MGALLLFLVVLFVLYQIQTGLRLLAITSVFCDSKKSRPVLTLPTEPTPAKELYKEYEKLGKSLMQDNTLPTTHKTIGHCQPSSDGVTSKSESGDSLFSCNSEL